MRRSDEQLVLQVGDDGAGLPPPPQFREGIGLSNTRARLQGLYGEAQSLTLGRRPGGGVTVTVTLPYREASEGGVRTADGGVKEPSASSPFRAPHPAFRRG